MQPVAAVIVVYAKDINRVANFYKKTLSVSTIEEERGFSVVGNDSFEIAVVRMAESIAKEIEISTPPQVRHETPIKCSFLVEDLNQVSAEATAAGGGTKPVSSAWLWRGQLHLDGHDPEGNVVQFRKLKD